MMRYLIDTNVCIAHLRGGNSALSARLVAENTNDVALCSIVKAELLFGAERSRQRGRNLEQLRQFFTVFLSLPFDDAAAIVYARIRTELEVIGTPIGPNDLLIASIALSRNVVLVTHNTSEFGRVSGLEIEDWQS